MKRGLLASVLVFVVACCLPALEFKNSSNAIDIMLIAIAIAGSTFSVVGRELPGDEGNVTKTTVVQLLPGFYVWMMSLVILPVALFFGGKNKNVQKYQNPV